MEHDGLMEEKLRKLFDLVAEVADINHSISLLRWDQLVTMPPGGEEERGLMLGTLSKLAHEKFTSDAMGRLLEELKEESTDSDLGDEAKWLIQVTARDFEKMVRIPPAYVSDKAKVIARSQQAWLEARSKSDYSLFRPFLEEVLDLCIRYIDYFPPGEHPYDLLLDTYEPKMKTSLVRKIFKELLPHHKALIQRIGEKGRFNNDFLHYPYSEKNMWEFSSKIACDFGLDLKRGRLDPSVHSFCQRIGIDDVRITSRRVPGKPFSFLFSTMHETGVALYEQGVGHFWRRTALEGGPSMGILESQSNIWENLVGRSFSFWEFYYPQLQTIFSSQLENVNLRSFLRGINEVNRSNIRLEADEITYNLHILVRLDLETAMIEGSLSAKDLPVAWNEKIENYLGIEPKGDAEGVLQDIHWSSGLFGIFPSYTLGRLISSQLWEKFENVYPDIHEDMRQGDFSALLSWLRIKIHQFGRKYNSQELVKHITGSEMKVEPYIHYLNNKYGEIYGL